ncbi:DUF1801 domain-containing protein [Corynebacterium kalidii]
MTQRSQSAQRTSPAMSPSGVPYTEVLDRVDGPRRAEADELVAMMRDITGEEPVVWAGRIIGFGCRRYRYDSGREGVMPVAAFATGARQHTVYLDSGFEERWAGLVRDLGKYRAGTSCLYISRLANVDMGVLRALVVAASGGRGRPGLT